jgi:hypothetical protein
MIRRIAIAVVGLFFLGLLGFSLLSWRAAIAPIERPNPASFTAESVAKGEVLAAEAHCVSCPHREWWTTICWRVWGEHAIRNHLRKR